MDSDLSTYGANPGGYPVSTAYQQGQIDVRAHAATIFTRGSAGPVIRCTHQCGRLEHLTAPFNHQQFAGAGRLSTINHDGFGSGAVHCGTIFALQKARAVVQDELGDRFVPAERFE